MAKKLRTFVINEQSVEGKFLLQDQQKSEHEILPGHNFIIHKVTQHLLLINTTTKRSSQR